ncbi:DUF3052 domain-containing protein [Corynebacterium sputi]|uniref:DUF3052 domain-containing protein n=1 Tax=Corynebacterium sputi TaxID=489915 RepID=UPI00042A5E3F|nr:DUF3052 domain-containing protein [Corynebacterium sputi]
MDDASGAARRIIELLGISKDSLVQEIGWDDDSNTSVSEAVETFLGEDLLDEDTDEVVDAVLYWYRDEDGDLVDHLVDITRPLSDEGFVWLLTPAAGTHGSVDAGTIAESAQLAGLTGTSTARLGDWQGTCLVPRGVKRQ